MISRPNHSPDFASENWQVEELKAQLAKVDPSMMPPATWQRQC